MSARGETNRYFPFLSRRQMNAARRAADSAVRDAVRTGVLVRQPCEACGKKRGAEAHHDDYTKALDVRWLCRKCHREWHRTHGGAVVSAGPFERPSGRPYEIAVSVDDAGPMIKDTTERLRAICDAIGVNESELAEYVGCSRQMVSNWFGGGFRTLKSIDAVCRALNLECSITFKPRPCHRETEVA